MEEGEEEETATVGQFQLGIQVSNTESENCQLDSCALPIFCL